MMSRTVGCWRWLQARIGSQTAAIRRTKPRRWTRLSRLAVAAELLEARELLSVTVASNYAGLSFNQSGGYIPPDTCGAAGPTSYVETVNQTVALYPAKTSAAGAITSSLDSFWFLTGGLPHPSGGSELSDPIVTYDEHIGRFIIGDQDVDFNSHVSNFDIAVSKTSNPLSLSSADWNFYKITTTEAGFDADYPGNFGYNHDAFVFTLNMFGVAGGGHVQVDSVNASDLASGVPQIALHAYKNDVNGFSFRPTTMHDSIAGDPMWLITEHGDNHSIDVVKMSNVLSNAATFRFTNLQVTPYSTVMPPLNPDGSPITFNIDSRILKSAEWNKSIVATHAVSISPIEDVAQWYQISVASGTPVLVQQGRVAAGANTYIYYPGIDINAAGSIGMSYMQSGTDRFNDYMSMYVTGRSPGDAPGTMETPVMVTAGTGLANYYDFGGRAGDLSGINVDPLDGTFWAANEFANLEFTGANWGTAIANFTPSVSLSPPQNVNAFSFWPTMAYVSWNPVSNAQGYRIFLLTNGGTTRTLLGTYGPSTTATQVNGLAPGATNELIVEAYNVNLTPGTADSAPVFVTTPGGLPYAPSVDAIATSPTTAMLAWNSVPGAEGYRIYEMLAGQQVLVGTFNAQTLSVEIVGLTPGSTTYFMVEAFLGSVVADSSWVSVTTPMGMLQTYAALQTTDMNRFFGYPI